MIINNLFDRIHYSNYIDKEGEMEASADKPNFQNLHYRASQAEHKIIKGASNSSASVQQDLKNNKFNLVDVTTRRIFVQPEAAEDWGDQFVLQDPDTRESQTFEVVELNDEAISTIKETYGVGLESLGLGNSDHAESDEVSEEDIDAFLLGDDDMDLDDDVGVTPSDDEIDDFLLSDDDMDTDDEMEVSPSDDEIDDFLLSDDDMDLDTGDGRVGFEEESVTQRADTSVRIGSDRTTLGKVLSEISVEETTEINNKLDENFVKFMSFVQNSKIVKIDEFQKLSNDQLINSNYLLTFDGVNLKPIDKSNIDSTENYIDLKNGLYFLSEDSDKSKNSTIKIIHNNQEIELRVIVIDKKTFNLSKVIIKEKIEISRFNLYKKDKSKDKDKINHDLFINKTSSNFQKLEANTLIKKLEEEEIEFKENPLYDRLIEELMHFIAQSFINKKRVQNLFDIYEKKKKTIELLETESEYKKSEK